MTINYFDAKGVFVFKTEKYQTVEKFFDFLEKNGIEFMGGYEHHTTEQIEIDVAVFKETVTLVEIMNIVGANAELYSSEDIIESAAETMEMSFSTDNWDSILKKSLTRYNYARFIEKYNNLNWIVSDKALGDIGHMLAEKIRKIGEQR